MAKQTLTVQLMHAQQRIAELEAQLAVAQHPRIPTTYVEYVNAARKAQRAEGRRVLSYMTRAQFEGQIRACA